MKFIALSDSILTMFLLYDTDAKKTSFTSSIYLNLEK